MSDGIARQKKVVLVVEDDPNMNRLICDVLNECGYNSISTGEWYGARGWLDRVKPDLFLIDFMLPDMNADKICRILMENEKTNNVPVIVMSSVAEFASKFANPASGATSFLPKPFRINDLIKEINQIMGGETRETNDDERNEFIQKADDFLDGYIRKRVY